MQDPDQTPSGEAPRPDATSASDATAAPSSAADPAPAAPAAPAAAAAAPPPPPPAPVTTSAPPPASQPLSGMPETLAGRPTGVTIIAVLAAIGGVFGIFGGLLLIGVGGFAGVATGSGAFGGLVALFGAVALISGILSLVFAWGAWGLQPWAWTLGVVLQAVSIVLALYNLVRGDTSAIISLAIAGVITYYLFQPGIRKLFGRA